MDSLSVRMANAATSKLQSMCVREVIRSDGRETMTMADGSVTIQKPCGQRRIFNKHCALVEALQVSPQA